MHQQLSEINQRLLTAVKIDQYAGYDPFDGLNSPLFKASPLYKYETLRLIWLQLHKRSVINFRSFVGIPKKRNPKGIGLFILGLLEDYARTKESNYLTDAIELGKWLLTHRSDQTVWKHSCWGYHFDWQARAFYVPVGKPNIISTVYVSRALYALGEVTQDKHYTDAALDSAHFILQHLLTQQGERQFLAYIPGETTFVHNASLWGAAWLAFVANKTTNAEMAKIAKNIALYSAEAQQADGSWVYGDRHHHQFIDGFHTGYNLEALGMIKQALATTDFDQVICRGYSYYKQQFFTQAGAVKYYHNKLYPMDMHCVAQAIFTLIKVGAQPEDFELATKVINYALKTLYRSDINRFCYQKTKFFTNSINYTRWTQAWCYFAFAFFNRSAAENY